MRKPKDSRACTRCNGRARVTYKKLRWCTECFDKEANTDSEEYLAHERQRAYFGNQSDYDPHKEAPGALCATREERRKMTGV